MILRSFLALKIQTLLEIFENLILLFGRLNLNGPVICGQFTKKTIFSIFEQYVYLIHVEGIKI
jgi:hypothetical protein